MRDIIALSTWRLHHWLIAAGVVVYLSIHAGIFPDLSAVFSWLADRPEVADAFREPHFGRADALILLYSTLFLGPLALLIATVLFLFTLAVLGGFVLPVVRVLNLPDWAATVTVLGGALVVVWLQAGFWISHSLWFFGLLARACKIVFA